ncbi:phosphotransferase enzyme family protein [Brachybacterium sp. J153]|uniref:phosphotransferase enzyme family protein n=1 Tax=Brachybacterium sp. J153 TaxID=3116488 RepID=UPI002E78966A|nr:phosphotransferase [Brachybacterium sp. J153]MEE1618508.1 phosphotransferase [Brachybacterium sp. J153]
MDTSPHLSSVLSAWSTLLGDHPRIDPAPPGRDLWPVTAADGRRYVLKRLGPWRNLPVADQARALAHLSRLGVRVAEFLVTEEAGMFAGAPEDSFVLMPHLPHDDIAPERSLPVEELVGRSVAALHRGLAAYPWDAHSYRESITEGLAELNVPDDVREGFDARRDEVLARIAPLSLQLVHGDLTPDNVLVWAADGAVSFIDLDHLPRAPRVWDLAKYVSRRLRRLPLPSALQNVERFVAGYHRTAPLAAEEVDALPAMILAMNLLEASWTARILSGLLERRLLPEQRAELEPTLAALRRQLAGEARLVTAIAAATTA